MSTGELQKPAPEKTAVESNGLPKPGLDVVFDEFFPTRALQAAGEEASRFLRLHPLNDRQPGDPTLLETRLIEARVDRTPKELKKMDKRFPDLDKGVSLLSDTWRKYGLHKFEKVTEIVPHVIMYDPIAAAVINTKYRLNGDPEIDVPAFSLEEVIKRQIMILSRQIGYIDVKIPFRPQKSVYDLSILHFCDIVQVTPDTPTTEPIRETHNREIDRDNMRSYLAKIAFLKTLAPIEGLPVIEIMAPNGSVLKPYKDGLMENLITPNSFRLLKKDHENGVPILPLAFNADLKRSFLPFYSSPDARYAVGEPIMPNLGLDDDALYKLLSDRLHNVGQTVTDLAIYRK